MDDFFGSDQEPEGARPISMKVWGRAANSVDIEIMEKMIDAIQIESYRCPTIWLEDDAFHNADQYEEIYGEPLTAHEALWLQKLIYAEVTERFRRARIVAQECDGSKADYFLRCDAEGIDPILERNTP